LILILVVLAALSMATSGWAANLIFNGDFELGNTGFLTDFRFKDDIWIDTGNNQTNDTGIWQPRTYTIAPNLKAPTLYHPDAESYFDHTHGNAEGNYMAVNGTVDGQVNLVWQQTIDNFDKTKPYYFSAWGSQWARSDIPGLFAVLVGADPNNPSTMDNISGVVQAGTDLGVWNYNEFMWTPRSDEEYLSGVVIQIFNLSDAYVGNDYALDDLSFHVVPIPQTVWLLGTACLFVLGLKRKIVK
jgi:hypothetical protein